jgi:hypothetical protein
LQQKNGAFLVFSEDGASHPAPDVAGERLFSDFVKTYTKFRLTFGAGV